MAITHRFIEGLPQTHSAKTLVSNYPVPHRLCKIVHFVEDLDSQHHYVKFFKNGTGSAVWEAIIIT